jgi:ubiquinone biosynthesis UbiH/UbiF/VisC/COQ6 family hydroxylase
MKHQIVICGAGIVGLTCALAMVRRGQKVTLLAPRVTLPPPAAPDTYAARVYAISPASQRLLAELGVWDALPAARLASVRAMEIYGDAGGKVYLDAWQAIQPELAWIVEATEIERVLLQWVQAVGIPWIADCCASYEGGTLVTAGGLHLQAELVVGADGAQSPLRAAAGLRYESKSYHEIGLVAHLEASLPHQETAFQWFETARVLALLPLPSTAAGSQVSMVWSMQTQRAEALQALPREQQQTLLCEWLAHTTQGRLGSLRLRGDLQGFPLTLERSQMVGPGIALIGDAAHRLHPLAGQGLNLGLGDIEALVRVVAERETYRSAGDPKLLRRYQRARAEPLLAMRFATDGLHRLFCTRAAPLSWLRNVGMRWVDASPGLKRFLIDGASR